MNSETIWTTALGEKIAIKDLSHQHFSNILWFSEVFNSFTRYNSEFHFELGLEFYKLFGDERLPWKPLPIPNEIEELKRRNLIDDENNIIFNNKIIGSIAHI